MQPQCLIVARLLHQTRCNLTLVANLILLALFAVVKLLYPGRWLIITLSLILVFRH